MSFLDTLLKPLLTADRLNRLGLRRETQADFDNLEPVIEFLCEPAHRLVMPEPKAAFKNIPEWFKKLPQFVPDGPTGRDQFGAQAMSAKGCLPLLDGMGLGYTLFSAVDMVVRTSACGKHMEIKSGPTWAGGSQHSVEQLGGSGNSPTGPLPALKFHNPWAIKTRKGFSTLFIPPLNATHEKRFQCLGAVVDTDVYPKHVNFPALFLAGPGVEIVIPAGTPLVTAIPFKRADVPRELIIRTMHAAERQLIGTMERVQNARSHMYTQELRADRKTNEDPERLSAIDPARCPMGHGGAA